jgi:hypothetical protein
MCDHTISGNHIEKGSNAESDEVELLAGGI